MTSKDRDCRPYREHDADLVADELVIRFIFVMIRQSSSYTSSKSLTNTRLFMSRDIYKSLHEMDSFDATTMGIICYTQKNKKV